jgi:hypothetical protein
VYPLRVIGRVVLGAGLLLTGVGAVLIAGAAVIAGDWWLAREPWIGIGLTSLVVGLATTAVAGLLLSVIEPIGMVRLLSIPPALIAAFLWVAIYLVPLSGACCQQPERDIRTLLYSQPEALAILGVATAAILLPLAIASRRQLARRRTAG